MPRSMSALSLMRTITAGVAASLLIFATPSLAAESDADAAPNSEPVVLQKMKTASGDPATIAAILEQLIGSWHQSPDNFSEAGKAWMAENNISGFFDTFSWGTNKAWIDFGDYRIVDGEIEKTGVGIISWHTGFKHMRFRESGARGGFVDGMLEIKDDNTIVRHYEFFAPNGDVSYHSDTWSFDPRHTECFSWQSSVHKNGEVVDSPARKFCKAE